MNFGATFNHFGPYHYEIYSANLSLPRNDPYRGWTLSHVTGYIADERYNSTTLAVRYRPIKRLQLGARYQKVDHFAERDQTIVSANWEMDKYQSIGGRLVAQDGDVNWFVSYSRRGNLGAEYFLIVGDPNTDTFQSSVILKVSIPLAIGG